MTQLAPALDWREFQLEKYGLVITIKQTLDARGAVYNFWNVTYGGRSIKTGLFECELSIPEILKHIADNTTLRTSDGDMLLRGLTWTALDGCEHAPADELRIGDRMVVGGTTTFTVKSITDADGDLLLVEFEGSPITRRFPKTHLCNLIERGPQP